LRGSAVRIQLKRLTDAGKLVSTASGYAIAGATEAVAKPLAA
jgi:hypothetical protein